MRNVSTPIINAGDNSASVTGSAQNTNQWVSASFQTLMGDTTAAGTVKIQCSNVLSTPTGTQWSDIPLATATVIAGVAPVILIGNMAFQWVRAVFTSTVAGSTTITVQANGLSI